MSEELTPDAATIERRKARIEEVRARFTAQVRRVHGPEMTVEFHPDALLEMFEGGQLDVPDDEWQTFLAAFDEGTFEPADEDESPEEIAEARKRARSRDRQAAIAMTAARAKLPRDVRKWVAREGMQTVLEALIDFVDHVQPARGERHSVEQLRKDLNAAYVRYVERYDTPYPKEQTDGNSDTPRDHSRRLPVG